MSLSDHLKGVPESDPPADVESDLDQDAQSPPPGEEPGQQTVDGDEGKPDEGRTIENVRHELLRKQEKFQRQLTQEIRSLVEAVSVQPSPTQQKSGNSLDDMSVADLKQSRPQIPEENRQAFDEYLTDRIINEQVESRVNAMSQQQSQAQARERAINDALRQYPELRDSSSDFYTAVDQRLADWGTAEQDPRAVLNAANSVALEQGILPAKRRTLAVQQQAVSKKTGKPVVKGDDEGDPLASEEAKKIQGRLAEAMPDKKFSPEQLDRVRERAKYYRENLGLYLKG